MASSSIPVPARSATSSVALDTVPAATGSTAAVAAVALSAGGAVGWVRVGDGEELSPAGCVSEAVASCLAHIKDTYLRSSIWWTRGAFASTRIVRRWLSRQP